ncbi:MAG: hypothetical protein ACI4ME_06170 [Aristaeellaceae bacterium]
MTDEQKRARIQRALNTGFAGLNTTPAQRERLLRQTIGGEEMNHSMFFLHRRPKLSFALTMLLMLLCLSVTAYAAGVLISGYYGKLAQMEASGSMIRWQLTDKISFVSAMQECGLSIDEADCARMHDAALPDAEREAAADRIIYGCYGELLAQEAAGWAQQPDSITEISPDIEIIFRTHYLASHPEGINTEEEQIAYADAWGYFWRDEYLPALRAAQAQLPQATPIPKGTEAYAVDILKSDMTEIYGWNPDAVNALTPEVKWDEAYQMWEVSGEVSEASMQDAFEPLLDGPNVMKTETGYRLTLLVDTRGNWWRENLDKEAFRAAHANDVEPLQSMTHDEGEQLARDAVMKRFSLTQEEMHRLFCDSVYCGLAEDQGRLCRYVFHPHAIHTMEGEYEATVNLFTGEVINILRIEAKE